MITAIIVAKNEASKIRRCIQAALQVSADVIVVDTGSTDKTVEVAQNAGARVEYLPWLGYGATKNESAKFAKTDWILSLDADEVLDFQLIEAIKSAALDNPLMVFQLQRITNLAGKWIKHSGWYPDHITRLFHRDIASWSLSPVHEKLIFPQKVNFRLLKGHIWHFSYDSIQNLQDKTRKYAQLNAEKSALKGKQASLYMGFADPWIKSIKIFIFLGGFLDGKAGWLLARNGYWQKKWEYKFLRDATLSEVHEK